MLLLILPTPAFAQGQLDIVQRLFEAAAFEEALTELTKVEATVSEDDALQAAEYRILCLLALGSTERTQAAVQTLLTKHPDYAPSARYSPRHREQFDEIRRHVLPVVIRSLYAEARASYVAKNYERAARRFNAVLDLLKVRDGDAEFADTREFASGFLELATRASAADRTAGTTGLVAPEPVSGMRGEARQGVSTERAPDPVFDPSNTSNAARAAIHDVKSTDVTPPTALETTVPAVSSSSLAAPATGLFEIVVNETGRVESATVRRTIDPQNDSVVLSDIRKWRFKPALRQGQPVKFRKLIEVYAVPLESLRR